jgi:hypothetical protein
VDSKFGQLCYPLTIREVWAASLDSCKCGQQVWTAVLSIDKESFCRLSELHTSSMKSWFMKYLGVVIFGFHLSDF